MCRLLGLSILGFSLALSAAGAGTAAVPASMSEVVSPRESLPLFNGKDLSGFHTWLVDTKRTDPRQVFTVVNGEIRVSGDGLGYLATERRYRNYRLMVEYRWGNTNTHWGNRVGKARDSGIFLHADGPDGNSEDGGGAFMMALECNLFQGATGDILLIRGRNEQGRSVSPKIAVEVSEMRDREGWLTWQPGGQRQTLHRMGRVNWAKKSPVWKDELDFRSPSDVEKPYGEWNQIECVCEGNRIQILLNGKLVNELLEVWPSEGRILLQCEGSEIYFRRLELQSLNRTP